MKKLSQKGALDAHFIVALIIVVVVGVFVVLRISSANEDTQDNASTDTVESADEVPEIETVVSDAEEENPDDDLDPEEPVNVDLEEEVETVGFSAERNTDYTAFLENNELEGVSFSQASFMIPADWTMNVSELESGQWATLTSPDGSTEIRMWDYDATLEYVEGGLAYASCDQFTNTGQVYYTDCETRTGDNSETLIWAAHILTDDDSKHYPPYDTGAQWRDFIVHDDQGTYFQGRLQQNPGSEDAAQVFDYLVETFAIPVPAR